MLSQLLDSLEHDVSQGGFIIDWHACDLFPQRWIDLVVVLRTDSTILYDRLQARHYTNAKIQENMDTEIMEVLLAEARDSYDAETVLELRSDQIDDMDGNIDKLDAWVQKWRMDHAKTDEAEN